MSRAKSSRHYRRIASFVSEFTEHETKVPESRVDKLMSPLRAYFLEPRGPVRLLCEPGMDALKNSTLTKLIDALPVGYDTRPFHITFQLVDKNKVERKTDPHATLVEPDVTADVYIAYGRFVLFASCADGNATDKFTPAKYGNVIDIILQYVWHVQPRADKKSNPYILVELLPGDLASQAKIVYLSFCTGMPDGKVLRVLNNPKWRKAVEEAVEEGWVNGRRE